MINNENIKDLVKKYIRNRSQLPTELQTIPIGDWDVSAVTDMSNLFKGFGSFNEPLNNWNTSNVTNMKNMFFECFGFNQPLPESFNTSNVTDMSGMFFNCMAFNQRLQESFNTSNVTNMRVMFDGCVAFNQPLPESFNTSNVTNMRSMFLHCKLYNQPFPNSFNTSNVTDMSFMFRECRAFNQPFPNSFNTSNVTNMAFMFDGCISFNQDISNWNVQNGIDMTDMLNGTPLLSHPPAWYIHTPQPPIQPIIEQPVIEQELVIYEDVMPEPITASTTSIPDNAVGMDIIEGVDVNIKQYLRENTDGFVFLSYTQYYPIEREQILHVINSNSSAIKYICAMERIVGSANKTVPYLNCKTLGLTTDLLVPLSQIKTMLTNNVRAVEIIPGEHTPYTVSLGVLTQTVNWLGASHCQAGQGGTLATLQELQNTMSDTATSNTATSNTTTSNTTTSNTAISGGRTKKRINKGRRTKKRRRTRNERRKRTMKRRKSIKRKK